MKTIFATIIVAFTALNFIPNTNNNTDENPEHSSIHWCEGDKLTWKDYRGKPNGQKGYFHALTAYEIAFNVSMKGSDIEFEVACDFVPHRSWVKSGKENADLLKHEQLHFDIAEIHARKLRKELMETRITFANLEAKANEIYERHWNNLNKMQEAYDRETDHSIIEEKQLEWDKKVAYWLNELKPYADNSFCR